MPQASDDRAAIVGSCALFTSHTPDECEAVALNASLHRYDAKKTIFIEGDQCEGLWILGSGQIKLHHSDSEGREYILSFPAPGTPLLLWSLLDRRSMTATATTLSDATLLFIPKEKFFDIIRHQPKVAGTIIGNLCSELRQRDIASGANSLKDAHGRVACRLLQLAHQHGERSGDDILIQYPVSRRDLGRATGITIETAVRTMSEWRRRGIVGSLDQRIAIHDLDALKGQAGCEECLYDCSVFGQALLD